ncbi:hypothetical protein L1787_13105 [Acuticoccus sp. M5D2P5]|uniref:hypothetical protein n=1 Tax=Acuticoccus kalidii TaxID=2910977 RepID=UPI001F37E057|nr:hypothetical protein [Acuticoccus kalidii]MCF3934348.1 hypothetical protein [Acuticoccus kalidii]
MTKTVTMVASRAFPLRDENGDGVRRAKPGETLRVGESEARAREGAGKAERVVAPQMSDKEG